MAATAGQGGGGRAVRRATWRVPWWPSGAASGMAAATAKRHEQEQSGKWKSEACGMWRREK
jgi:hypothetical protein